MFVQETYSWDFNIYFKDLQLNFDNYAEAYDGIDNTSKSSMIPHIELHPCANATFLGNLWIL